MKTNQLLTLTFNSCDVTLLHNTAYGDLSKVLNAANAYRMTDGDGKPIQLATLLSTEGFKRQCELLENDPDFTLDPRGAWYKVGKSAQTRTEAHLLLLLYVAQVVSPRFHYEFNKRVVMENLCRWRDESGNEFIALNSAIDLHCSSDGSNIGRYINAAKIISKRINPDGGSWNTASADQLRERARIEAGAVQLLRLGVVKNWEHLKDLLERV